MLLLVQGQNNKYIMKPLFASVALTLSLSLFGCGNQNEKKQNEEAVPHDTTQGVSAEVPDLKTADASLAYICPCGGCPEVKEAKPGKCPKCEMDLVEEKK